MSERECERRRKGKREGGRKTGKVRQREGGREGRWEDDVTIAGCKALKKHTRRKRV